MKRREQRAAPSLGRKTSSGFAVMDGVTHSVAQRVGPVGHSMRSARMLNHFLHDFVLRASLRLPPTIRVTGIGTAKRVSGTALAGIHRVRTGTCATSQVCEVVGRTRFTAGRI